MKRGLIALAAGTFALGIAEFGMMGMLSDVAKGIGVDIVKAGHLISAYSLGVAIGAPTMLFAIGGPLQYTIVRVAKGGEMLGGAGIQIAFNVSNACAAMLGGMAIKLGFGIASPALVGAFMLYLLHKKYNQQTHLFVSMTPIHKIRLVKLKFQELKLLTYK